jgi:hypothetical protein
MGGSHGCGCLWFHVIGLILIRPNVGHRCLFVVREGTPIALVTDFEVQMLTAPFAVICVFDKFDALTNK